MAILGHGIDIVDVARVARLLEEHGDAFLTRCYTPAEQAESLTRGVRRPEFLAGRFAAKEAILKALGTGLALGISWQDIEVLADNLGRPIAQLSGRAAELAARAGISRWWVSISHTHGHATASALAEG